jgi:hypothetical protein
VPTEYPRYHVHALVARRATLELAIEGASGARLLPLRFGLALLPVTDELLATLGPPDAVDGPASIEFVRLTPALVRFAVEASRRGPIAYLECEMADGAGFHAALAWQGGACVFGPLHREDRSPANAALRLLGVTASGGADEFTTLGVAALC